jgi:hypothetical protein
MRIPITKKQIKVAKKSVRAQLKNARITLKDLAADDRCPIGYQTVKEHFSEGHPYWNQKVTDLALEMIEEKKSALITTK